MSAVRGRIAVAAASAVALLCTAPAASAIPIVDTGTPSLPPFQGAAATKHKLKDPTIAPQNPYMAPNPNSNIHNDTWMTDAYQRQGPLGNALVATSEAKPPSLCGSIAFDSQGRIVSVCPSVIAPPQARIIDPNTLATISTYDLPNAPNPPNTPEYQNFTGGGYFFLDDRGPDLGADQDRPHLRPRRGRRRQHADTRAATTT